MVVAIVGSRDYPRLDLVRDFVLNRLVGRNLSIVSGGAIGVDHIAECAARERGLPITVVLPDWKTYGKGAGMRRNGEIVRLADIGVAFWNGQSRGTLDTIRKFRKVGKPVTVHGPDGEEIS